MKGKYVSLSYTVEEPMYIIEIELKTGEYLKSKRIGHSQAQGTYIQLKDIFDLEETTIRITKGVPIAFREEVIVDSSKPRVRQ